MLDERLQFLAVRGDERVGRLDDRDSATGEEWEGPDLIEHVSQARLISREPHDRQFVIISREHNPPDRLQRLPAQEGIVAEDGVNRLDRDLRGIPEKLDGVHASTVAREGRVTLHSIMWPSSLASDPSTFN